jgi:hypothetical protein
LHELSTNFLKKKFFGHEKKPFDLQQKKLPGCFAPICHTATIYTTREQLPIAKIDYLVKVFTNTTTATRIESQPAPARTRKEKKEETWFVSRHYDPRTEVRRGGTPEVLKL